MSLQANENQSKQNENASKQSEHSFNKQNSSYNGKPAGLNEDFHDFSKNAGSMATDAVHMVKDNASRYYDQGMQQAKKFGKKVESRIQKKPLQSLLIVASVGLLLGRIWSRR